MTGRPTRGSNRRGGAAFGSGPPAGVGYAPVVAEGKRSPGEERLTDDRIITSRRDVLRRIGGAAAVVAFGGIAAACGEDGQSGTSSTTSGTTPDTEPDVSGATLSRPEYTGSGAAGADTDVARQADPKGDTDITTTGDPVGGGTDGDVTVYADPVGGGTDNDPTDPVGGGTDNDVTVYGDPVGGGTDGDVSTTADPKGDTDVTTTADPVRPRP